MLLRQLLQFRESLTLPSMNGDGFGRGTHPRSHMSSYAWPAHVKYTTRLCSNTNIIHAMVSRMWLHLSQIIVIHCAFCRSCTNGSTCLLRFHSGVLAFSCFRIV
jgi:hypothetical protein